ncbi:MAG: hypothetical protein RLZZ214_2954 [Verrucomicrobiota bacterium]|jgi:hypothetical protein
MTIKTPLSFVRFLAPVAFAFPVGSAAAATFHSIPLAWNAPPETGITGYKVYVGAASQQYTQVLSAGTNLALSVANMEFGKTYYFAVTAIGSTGLESLLSSELAVKIAQPPVPVGGGISTNGSGQTGLNWSYPVSAFSSSPQFIVESSPDLVQWTQVATVLPAASTGGTSQTAQFSWPFAITGTRKFYRLTARNWMGSATGL